MQDIPVNVEALLKLIGKQAVAIDYLEQTIAELKIKNQGERKKVKTH